MQPNMNPGHHNNHQGQALTDEEIKALLTAQLNQQPKPGDNPEVSQPLLLKQPYGYGETCDSDIADLLDDLFW